MKLLLLLTLFFFSFVHANKVLYLNYEKVPERVVQGEVFSVTIKTITTVSDYDSIQYSFSTKSGVRILNTIPYREQKGKFFLDTFKFIAISPYAKIPDITATLIAQRSYESATLTGKKLNVIKLNPKADFSNVIASSFELLDYKTTSFDNKNNIVVFSAQAQNSSLDAMQFRNVLKQGVESISQSNVIDPKITYFVIIKKEIEQFNFTYFNVLENKFMKVSIPIVVDDDSVTTQTDLKPIDQSKEQLKVNIAIGIGILFLLIAIFKKRFIYLVLMLFPLAYAGYLSIPSKDVCIRKGSSIYLLPVSNGTIFEEAQTQYILSKEGTTSGYTKVKLQDDKIGWVKNEDLCSY